MDTILFYGDQDEATRRQVRSVAAQYSHRIGPRKRKKSKLPAKQPGLENKRGHYKKLTANDSDIAAASSSSHQSRPSQKTSVNAQHAQHDHNAQVEQERTRTLETQQREHREHLLRRELSGSETCASSSEVGSEPTRSPHTPQLDFFRHPGASQSPEHPPSAYRRLPAYTWTEYPRYAVSQTGSASPSNASAIATATKRPAFELPDPAALGVGLGLQQSPPRSHPMDMPSRPLQSSVKGSHSDDMLSRNPQMISGDGHAMSKAEVAPGQLSSPPRLQILRCAAEVKGESSDDASRWRSGAADVFSPATSPG